MRAEDHRVHLGLLQRPRVAPDRGGLGPEGSGLRSAARAPGRRAGRTAFRRRACGQLRVPPGGDGRLGRHQADAPVSRHLDGGAASGVITPTTGTEIRSWRSGSRRGRRVAGDEDQLHALRRGNRRSRARIGAPRRAGVVGQRAPSPRRSPRAAWSPGTRGGRSARPCPSRRRRSAANSSGDCKERQTWSTLFRRGSPISPARRSVLRLPASAAHAYTRRTTGCRWATASRWPRRSAPDGAPPQGGWPAVLALHGLGQDRSVMNAVAEAHLAPHGYVVLTVERAGTAPPAAWLVGPREVADYAAALQWLRSSPASATEGRRARLLAGRRLRLEALDRARHASPPQPRDDVDEPLRRSASAGPRQVRAHRLLPQPAAARTVGSRGHRAQGRRAPGPQRRRDPDIRRPALRPCRPRRIRTPVFMLQGRRDYAFDMQEALAAFGRLRGPKRIYLGDLGHARRRTRLPSSRTTSARSGCGSTGSSKAS